MAMTKKAADRWIRQELESTLAKGPDGIKSRLASELSLMEMLTPDMMAAEPHSIAAHKALITILQGI